MRQSFWIVIGILLLVLSICCCCLAAFLIGWQLLPSLPPDIPTPPEINIVTVVTPTPFIFPTFEPTRGLVTATPAPSQAVKPSATPTPTTPPALPTATESPRLQVTTVNDTLITLQNVVVPTNDLVNLAQRLEGKQDIPKTVAPPATPFKIGDRKQFWVSNVDTNENFQIDAVLRYETAHVYFWIQQGVGYDFDELKRLVDTFEEKIYPTNRAFFGSEWTPGVDGDEHLYILLARGLGENLAGYFSSVDELHPLAHEYSNAHEMFILNADNIDLGRTFTYGVLAHEFQHMIHWYQDRNESSWINEGFSEVAAFLNGYYTSGFDFAFSLNPDVQLNDWPDSDAIHYGKSFLFLMYFLDRFGERATQALVVDPNNDLVSLDEMLSSMQAKEPGTNDPLSADDLFLDWVITNYLQDASVGSGQYTYRSYTRVPAFNPTETIRRCPVDSQERTVSQYGADYIRFTCQGNYTLSFQGSSQVSVLPENPHSGKYAFWSNRGDESNMTLTQTFDFSAVNGPITLSYWTWYDLETDYDYLYLEASLDGKFWQILKTPSGTDEDPSGNSYGWGYNGVSGGGSSPEWIQESVDLSQFAGKKVQLRFEYVTDAAVHGEGFMLDDIEIPAIGYASDFEADTGGWEAAGWARIQNILPQSYRLALITRGRTIQVQYLDLAANNALEIPLKIGGNVSEAVLVVTGTTRFTRQPAPYQFEIRP